MSLTSMTVAIVVTRLGMQRYKDHLEQVNWPYAAVQKEVERNYVVEEFHRKYREARPVASDDDGQRAGHLRHTQPVVRIVGG